MNSIYRADLLMSLLIVPLVGACSLKDEQVLGSVLRNDGEGSTLDADTLDGQDSADFAVAGHSHAGEDITSGVVPEAQIDTAITRDTEVLGLVKAVDGDKSGLDADTIDTLHATDFATSATHADGIHTHAADEITTGTIAEERVHSSICRHEDIFPEVLLKAAEVGSTLNADTLDGFHATDFATSATHTSGIHLHAGEDITSGTVAEARIDQAICRDAELIPYITDSTRKGDGTGNLIADRLLDDGEVRAPSYFSVDGHTHDGDAITSGDIAADRVPATIARKPAGVAVVAQGADVTETGDYPSPVDALDDHAAWCPSLSATERCLLKIMPGEYDLAGASITMRRYIDIQGSGRHATRIKSTLNGYLITAASDTTLADLSLFATGTTGTTSGGYDTTDTTTLRLKNVLLSVTGDGDDTDTTGLRFRDSTDVTLDNCEVTVTAAAGSGKGMDVGLTDGTAANYTLNHTRIEVNQNAAAAGVGLSFSGASTLAVKNSTLAITGVSGANVDALSQSSTVDGHTLSVVSSTLTATTLNAQAVALRSNGDQDAALRAATLNATSSLTGLAICVLTEGATTHTLRLEHSVLETTQLDTSDNKHAVKIDGSNKTVLIAATQFTDKMPACTSGTITCVGSYDSSFAIQPDDCRCVP
jgi:hypothetical protein